MGDEYQGEYKYRAKGGEDNTSLFIWNLIIFFGLVITVVVAWPHLFQ